MCNSGMKPYSLFLPPQSWIISLLFHTFSLYLLYHRVCPSQNVTLQPPAFVKTSLQLLLLSPEYFLPAFNLPSLLFPFPQSLLVCTGFLLSKRKKKCLFHVLLPFISYNNITSPGSVPHAMTSWPLCAPFSLISFADFLFFPVTQIEFCKFIKDLFLLSQSSTFCLLFPYFQSIPLSKISKCAFFFSSLFQSISKTSQLFLCRPLLLITPLSVFPPQCQSKPFQLQQPPKYTKELLKNLVY